MLSLHSYFWKSALMKSFFCLFIARMSPFFGTYTCREDNVICYTQMRKRHLDFCTVRLPSTKSSTSTSASASAFAFASAPFVPTFTRAFTVTLIDGGVLHGIARATSRSQSSLVVQVKGLSLYPLDCEADVVIVVYHRWHAKFLLGLFRKDGAGIRRNPRHS